MKHKIIIPLLSTLISTLPLNTLLGFQSGDSEYSGGSNETGFSADGENTYSNAKESTYLHSDDPILGTMNGIPFRKPEDLSGFKADLVPLVLDPGTTLILDAIPKNMIGDETITNSLSSFFFQNETELTVNTTTYFKATGDTDPGTKAIIAQFSWIPGNSNQAKFTLFYKVKTDTIDPKSGRFIDEIGKAKFIVNLTDSNGGTYSGEIDAASVTRDQVRSIGRFGENYEIEGWATSGNLIFALPGEIVRTFDNINGLDKRTGSDYILASTGGKPDLPISEAYFGEELDENGVPTGPAYTLTVQAFSNNGLTPGARTQITTFDEFKTWHTKVADSKNTLLFVGSTHPRFWDSSLVNAFNVELPEVQDNITGGRVYQYNKLGRELIYIPPTNYINADATFAYPGTVSWTLGSTRASSDINGLNFPVFNPVIANMYPIGNSFSIFF